MTRISCKYIGFFRVGAISAFSARYKKTTKSCLRTKKTALHNWSRLRSKKRSRIHQKCSQNAPKIAPKTSQRPPQSAQRAPQELHGGSQEPPEAPNMTPKALKGCPRCLRGPIWVAFWHHFDLKMEVSEPIFTQIRLKFTLLTGGSSF